MSKLIDLTGQRFGRLTVLSRSRTKNKSTYWNCECECGGSSVAISGNLKRGTTKSCGCLKREVAISSNTTHGECGGKTEKPSAELIAYGRAARRCRNPKEAQFPNYGARGIEFRFTSFEQFLLSVGRRPSPQHSLDRIDVNGHYEPGNVRWATQTEQQNNKRNNRIITFNGQTATMTEWSRQTGIQVGTIFHRLAVAQWCVPCSLTVNTGDGICAHKKDNRQYTAYAQSGSYPTLGEIGTVAIIAVMFAIVGGLQ